MTYKYETIAWAEGKIDLNPADAGEQNKLRNMFEEELAGMGTDDVQLLANLLIKKGSSFIAAVLHRYDVLTTRQKVAALNSLAKRRRQRVAEFRNAPIALEFEVLNKMSPKRRLKIINIFIGHSKAKNSLTEEQFDTLLFPLSTTHTARVGELKELIFRKKMIKQYTESKLADMIIAHEICRFRALMAEISDEDLGTMIREGNWPDSIRYAGHDSLLTNAIKRGLIKKE